MLDELADHPDTLYIVEAGVMSILFYNGTLARDVVTTGAFRNIVRTGSWDTYSPRFYAQLDGRVDDADNLLSALLTENNVCYVGVAHDGIEQFLREHVSDHFSVQITEFEGMQTKIFRYAAE